MNRLSKLYRRTDSYLRERLIPFWTERLVEPQYGGFQTNYDREGRRTEVSDKTLLAQGRSLFTIAHTVRLGHEWPGWEQALAQGIAFMQGALRDSEHDGYFWIVDAQGRPLDDNKVLYGHSFVIYGLAEAALLTDDVETAALASEVFELVQARCADSRFGGYLEHFDRAWEPKRARDDVQLFKSLDVHMHLMEAYTALFELTGESAHRRALEDVCELIWRHMIDPATGTGMAMFTQDWQPITNVELDTVWGSDRFEQEKPSDITSYGHNIELAWLYAHALEVLGIDPATALPRLQPILEHTAQRGVDWEHGGLYVEGRREGDVTENRKEFWQQAEALVGFAEGFLLTREERYVEALENVHAFVFEKMVNWPVGEWFPLLDRRGKVLWDYMGHNWKTCYHTVRSMCELLQRLAPFTEAVEREEPA